MSQPQYARIKDYIVQHIESRKWLSGDRVGSENQLAAQFSVSRMTARRALQELSDEGVLVRAQGLGTFVADARPMSSILEIRNIAEEIESRSHRYSGQLVALNQVKLSHAQAPLLELIEDASAFHSTMVHCENDVPIQYEERFVNPALAPNYLQQNFESITPNVYLSEVAPLTEADHVVEAITANHNIANLLSIPISQACLQITRRTWSRGSVVSLAYLIHPGNRYRLGGHLNF